MMLIKTSAAVLPASFVHNDPFLGNALALLLAEG